MFQQLMQQPIPLRKIKMANAKIITVFDVHIMKNVQISTSSQWVKKIIYVLIS